MDERTHVGVLDYGCGNIRSVCNALEMAGGEGRLVSSGAEMERCRCLVLPGVGSFDHAMNNLRERGFVERLAAWIDCPGHRLLGICLGMQLLCLGSDESTASVAGLGFIEADVKSLRERAGDRVKVPHMGWNSIEVTASAGAGGLLRDISDDTDFYFLHSYGVYARERGAALAQTRHGEACFDSVITNGANVFGMQFHPEKSQSAGLHLLKNFLADA